MKKLLLTIGVGVAMATSAYAQGVVAFANGGGGLNSPIYWTDGTTLLGNGSTSGAVSDWSIELRVGSTAGSVSQTVATAPSLTFNGFLTATSGTTVSGFASGTVGFFQVLAWQTSAGSYENSTIRGQSSVFSYTLASGTGNPPPLPPYFTAGNDPNGLGGLQSFAVSTTVIPEPSTIVLGLMGGLGLLLRRRK